MKIHYDIENIRIPCPIVTIGIFDGIHLGHKILLNKLIEVSKKVNGETTIVTLWPHPRVYFNKTENFGLLTLMDEKIALLEKLEIDNLIIIEFNEKIANLSYDKFITDYLIKRIDPCYIIVGNNHHFGKNREGNIEKLQEFSKIYGFKLETVNISYLNNFKISSTTIRNLIINGDIKNANQLLGYEYFIKGIVVRGTGIGRKIGFPTANIKIDDFKLKPHTGVYAVNVIIDKKVYNGMMNIGYRPTIDEQKHELTFEVNIFDFDADIYEKEITVKFIDKLRDEQKFKTIDELISQLYKDKEKSFNLLKKIKKELN